MKKLVLPILFPVVLAFLSVSIWFGLGPNLGLSFGYYGEFNRTIKEIKSISRVELLEASANMEAEVEEMLFELLYRRQYQITLYFDETPESDELFKEANGVYFGMGRDKVFVALTDLSKLTGKEIMNARDVIESVDSIYSRMKEILEVIGIHQSQRPVRNRAFHILKITLTT